MTQLDLNNTTIAVTTPCGDCEATGTVADPTGFYLELDHREKAWEQDNPCERGDDLWHSRRADAFESIQRDWLAECGLRALPPEEANCPECDGSGRQTKDIPLIAVADAFLAHIRKTQGGIDVVHPFFD